MKTSASSELTFLTDVLLWERGMIKNTFLRPDRVGGERGCMVFKTN